MTCSSTCSQTASAELLDSAGLNSSYRLTLHGAAGLFSPSFSDPPTTEYVLTVTYTQSCTLFMCAKTSGLNVFPPLKVIVLWEKATWKSGFSDLYSDYSNQASLHLYMTVTIREAATAERRPEPGY